MRVLYVEDNEFDADLTHRTLSRLDPSIELDTVATVAAATVRLERESGRWDVVLTDLHLPDGSGEELVRWIRARGLEITTVVLTGYGDDIEVRNVMAAGADDYALKGLGYVARLPATLEAAARRRRAIIDAERADAADLARS